jgi:hypothetical protein
MLLGTLLLLAGTIAGVVNREVLDAGRFADHVNAVRADPAVSRELGALVTERILADQPDLTAMRPLLESTVTSIIASPALGSAARATAAGPLYRTLTGRPGGDSRVLRLADVAALAVGAVAVVAPEQRAALPAELDVRLSRFGSQDATGEALSWVHLVGWMSWLLPLLGLALLVLAGATLDGAEESNRSRMLSALGAVGRGAVAAACVLAGLLVVLGFLVGRTDDSTLSGAVLQAVWHQLDGTFWAAAGLLAAIGYLLSLAGRSGLARLARGTSPRELVAQAWAQVLDPGPRLGPRTVRAAFLLLIGIALALQPLQVATALLWALGIVLVVLAAALLVSIAAQAVRDWSRRSNPAARLRDRVSARTVVVGVALVALVGAFVFGALPAGDDLPDAMGHDDETCNGYAALCNRAYDDVAFPATHNSMSAADEGWFFAEQPDGIVAQLDHGIRTLLIDSWYGQRTQRRGIIANTDDSRAAALEEAATSFGKPAVESALRVRDALNLTPRGPVEPYLCHALCELGATKWLPVMKQVRDWMAGHPREVVTFIVQDTVTPADTAEVFRQAGLLPYVYTPAAGDRAWPTLGQMIESGQRLVVMMEEHGGGTTYPWLLPAFQVTQDTPYLFRRATQFNCDPNRGPSDAPLFLLNHWITDKRREVSNAAEVNARDVLLPRAEECQAERGLLPNFIAVDFYDRGDLFGVVDTLNDTE